MPLTSGQRQEAFKQIGRPEWPEKDQCQIPADSHGTKCTDLAMWLVLLPQYSSPQHKCCFTTQQDESKGVRACTKHLPLALSNEIQPTDHGKVIVMHYTS